MNRRNTLILLVVLAALATYTYFGEIRKGEEKTTESASTQPTVFDLPQEKIVGLKVTTGEGQTVELKREVGKPWGMVTPASAQVDEVRVSDLVQQLASLQVSRAITPTGDIAQYGLVTGTLTADITLNGGATHQLLVGETNPTGSAYYALADGKQDVVYLLYTGTVDDLQRLVSEPPYAPTPMPTVAPSPTIEILPPITATVTVTATVPTIEIVPSITATGTVTNTSP
jgi:hypothetical protein